MKRSNLIHGVLLIIILFLLYFSIFRKPEVIVEPFDDTALREEIANKDSLANYWQAKAIMWQEIANIAEAKSDSIEGTKTVIKHHYHEVYNIIPTSTTVQLDSIIRSNW